MKKNAQPLSLLSWSLAIFFLVPSLVFAMDSTSTNFRAEAQIISSFGGTIGAPMGWTGSSPSYQSISNFSNSSTTVATPSSTPTTVTASGGYLGPIVPTSTTSTTATSPSSSPASTPTTPVSPATVAGPHPTTQTLQRQRQVASSSSVEETGDTAHVAIDSNIQTEASGRSEPQEQNRVAFLPNRPSAMELTATPTMQSMYIASLFIFFLLLIVVIMFAFIRRRKRYIWPVCVLPDDYYQNKDINDVNF